MVSYVHSVSYYNPAMAVSVTGHPKVWVLVLTCPIGKWFTPQCVFEMLIFFCPAHICPDSEVSPKLVWSLQISVQFPQLLLHWCGHVLCLLSSGVWLMLEQVESGHPHLSSLSYSSQEFYLCAERWASLQVLAAHDVILLYNWGPSLGQKHVRRKTEKQKGMKFVAVWIPSPSFDSQSEFSCLFTFHSACSMHMSSCSQSPGEWAHGLIVDSNSRLECGDALGKGMLAWLNSVVPEQCGGRIGPSGC